MRFIIQLASLISLAGAAAIPHPTPAIVTLRLISPPQHTHHYTSSQQIPTTAKGDTLHVMVGQALSMDTAPLYLQAVEITGVTEGVALTDPPREVAEDDGNVLCMVKTGHTSSGLIFGMEAGVLPFGGLSGGLATVTGVECWVP